MITADNKQLAQWAMDHALKNGCQAARVILYSNANSSYELRNGKVDRLQQAAENGLVVSLYVDGRYGSISTNRMDKDELRRLIAEGIASAACLAPDEARTLPDPSRYYKGGMPDLALFDKAICTVGPDEKIDMARAAAEEAMSRDSRIVSVDTAYGDGRSSSYRIASNGFEGETRSTWFSLSASVVMKDEGGARPADSRTETSLTLQGLRKQGVGAEALRRVARRLGQSKAESGRYTMVVDNLNARRLLAPMLNALQGESLQQRNSFLLGRLGDKVASALLTVRDEPHRPGAFGSRYFDGEGVATMPRTVFSEGVPLTCYIDTYNAAKMGVEPTVASPSRLVLQPGSKPLAELVADVDRGILVTGFNGGNCNSSTGDFSYGIEGFLIDRGAVARPVNEMNVTGSMQALWQSLAAVGNDPCEGRSWLIPTLVFDNVAFSGR